MDSLEADLAKRAGQPSNSSTVQDLVKKNKQIEQDMAELEALVKQVRVGSALVTSLFCKLMINDENHILLSSNKGAAGG